MKRKILVPISIFICGLIVVAVLGYTFNKLRPANYTKTVTQEKLSEIRNSVIDHLNIPRISTYLALERVKEEDREKQTMAITSVVSYMKMMRFQLRRLQLLADPDQMNVEGVSEFFTEGMKEDLHKELRMAFSISRTTSLDYTFDLQHLLKIMDLCINLQKNIDDEIFNRSK